MSDKTTQVAITVAANGFVLRTFEGSSEKVTAVFLTREEAAEEVAKVLPRMVGVPERSA